VINNLSPCGSLGGANQLAHDIVITISTVHQWKKEEKYTPVHVKSTVNPLYSDAKR